MSVETRAAADSLEQVWSRLRSVTDPELDNSVVDLGFVTDVGVESGGRVHIMFRLPTYWCAANFAFLMADDMRRAVAALPWVASVSVKLGEHMEAEAINAGVCGGKTFEETFGARTTQGLDALRRVFAIKAFQRRQEALLRFLLAAGHRAEALLEMRIGALEPLAVDATGRALVDRYLARRSVVGPAAPECPAFVDHNGVVPGADAFAAYLARLRLVRVNMETNGALCRGLLAERFSVAGGRQP